VEIAKISKQGFWLTAILVAILWCLLIANRLILHRAEVDAGIALRERKYLQLRKDSGKAHSSSGRHSLPASPGQAIYQTQI
jgi:hypothetical protein